MFCIDFLLLVCIFLVKSKTGMLNNKYPGHNSIVNTYVISFEYSVVV